MPPKKGQPQTVNRRCTYIKRDGTRCKKNAMIGVDVCNTAVHGGSLPGVKAKAKRMKAEVQITRKLGYGNASVDESHVGANPVSGLAWELRRTAGKIVFIEEELAKMNNAEIIWGRTLEERKEGEPTYGPNGSYSGDTSYSLTRDEARVNLWAGLGAKERQHYAQLCKIAISAGFEERRIRLQEEIVLSINTAITNIISNLGADPDEPSIRQMVRVELLRVQDVDAE